MIWRWLTSTANACGLALATVVLLLKGLGWLGALAWLLAPGAYVIGFIVGGVWLGFPRFGGPSWHDLEFADTGDSREAMELALTGVRSLVRHNPDDRLPSALQHRVLALCDSLAELAAQLERSKGALSLQEGFHARHIAISYLPDALKTYLSIPAKYASTQVLPNGKTALATFRDTLNELDEKTKELADDLASQDAHAFLSHSQFLHQKFGAASVVEAPSLTTLPTQGDTRK
ncbi:MAG TPA: hypothetical protein VJ001_00420 [Rhodocyclaceae bacterium]|nr:hypothetical protein [Rhodocyclaceae bacterium]